MIELLEGSLFDCGAEALVNPVNCRGATGAGLAQQFEKNFPRATAHYKRLCKLNWVKPGSPFVAVEGDEMFPRVIFWPTKDHWRNPSRLEWVESGAKWLRGYLSTALWVPSVAVPAVGCGLGGLDWGLVLGVLERELSELPARVLLFPPK